MEKFLIIAKINCVPGENTPKQMILMKSMKGDSEEEVRARAQQDLDEEYVETGKATSVEIECKPTNYYNENWSIIEEIW